MANPGFAKKGTDHSKCGTRAYNSDLEVELPARSRSRGESTGKGPLKLKKHLANIHTKQEPKVEDLNEKMFATFIR